jgi:dienelactone hydrolase
VTLSGSLYRPKTPGRHPAVVFLHGAGAEVRWGASRFFADYLARRGIAGLIYDKRGTGASTGDWRRSDFDDLAADAVAAIELVKRQPGIDPRRIGIYGHSQGGTIGPLVATRSPDVAFVISAAGGAIPMWRGEIHSLRTQTRAEGTEGESLSRADRYIERMIAVARTGTGWDDLHAAWRAATDRNEPWARLLEPPPKDFYFWSFFPRIADYDAATFWRRVTVPVLVVQAGRDIYVPVEESIPAIDAALRQAGNRDYTIVTLPGAPHNLVLQPDPGSGLEWPRIYLGYADLVTSWICYRTASPPA